jgi:hypothetical protein
MVHKVWNTKCNCTTAIDIWQFKFRLLRKKLKGLNINFEAALKKKKTTLLQEFDILDVFSEQNQLDASDKMRMEEIKAELDEIWSQEETKAWQRSRDRQVVEGDRNTSYFHTVANQRRRKKNLSVLIGPNGPVETTEEMLDVAAIFYKNLFAKENRQDISLDDGFWDMEDLLTDEEASLLDTPFTEKEIHDAIMGSYAAGAPGPDGFSFLFYQKFWDLIKFDFMALVRDFESGTLDVSRLNDAIITLIPKEHDAKDMKKFRPISLGNCSLKVITKAITNRIAPISNRMIANNQTAFIKGRYILESVVAAHEVIHDVYSKKHSGLVLKLDYEKAYDRIDWEFLDSMLQSRNFSPKFRTLIKSVLYKGSFCVRINDSNSSYFVAGKGLKQGDPLSPILFNYIADVFTKILYKAARNNLISGLLPSVVPGGVISLQYADDTILFLEKDVEMARNLKWLLTCFEQMSGMRINYHKSDFLTINVEEDEARVFAQIFGCKLAHFPFIYLGVPLHFSKLKK